MRPPHKRMDVFFGSTISVKSLHIGNMSIFWSYERRSLSYTTLERLVLTFLLRYRFMMEYSRVPLKLE